MEDDPLDSGGRVIEGGPFGNIKGEDGKYRKMAYVGQLAWCERCKSAGAIMAAPGAPSKKRFYDEVNGRPQALGGDWVMCKCERHPRILPVHGRKWKVSGNRSSLTDKVSASVAASAISAAVSYDDKFILRDAQGRALTQMAYALRRVNGAFEYGKTDEKGQTNSLSPIAEAERVCVFIAR